MSIKSTYIRKQIFINFINVEWGNTPQKYAIIIKEKSFIKFNDLHHNIGIIIHKAFVYLQIKLLTAPSKNC